METTGSDLRPSIVAVASSLARAPHYALRKRLIVPSWWLEGLLFGLDKTIWAVGATSPSERSALLVPQKMSASTLQAYAQLWHGIALQVLDVGAGLPCQTEGHRQPHSGAAPGIYSLSLAQISRGTPQQMLRLADDLQGHLMSPLDWHLAGEAGAVSQPRPFTVKQRRAPGGRGRHQRFAFVSGMSRTEGDADPVPAGVHFQIAFRASLADTFWGYLDRTLGLQAPGAGGRSDLATDCAPSLVGAGQVVTLNPSVLQSLAGGHAKASASRLVLYLWLELRKAAAFAPGAAGRIGGCLGPDLAHTFCSELMSRASSLYDHGVLGWVDLPPSARLSECTDLMTVPTPWPGVYQHVVLSESAEQVHAFECALFDRTGQLRMTLDDSHSADAASLPAPSDAPSGPPAAGSREFPAAGEAGVTRPVEKQVRTSTELVSVEGTLVATGDRKTAVSPDSSRAQGGLGVGKRRVGPLRRLTVPPPSSRLEPLQRAPSVVDKPRGVIRPATARPHPARLGDPSPPERPRSSSPGEASLRSGEIEYALRLAQYYESLSPLEREELDREMRLRSPKEFRDFIGARLSEGLDPRH